jgi:hypothetical protein
VDDAIGAREELSRGDLLAGRSHERQVGGVLLRQIPESVFGHDGGGA